MYIYFQDRWSDRGGSVSVDGGVRLSRSIDAEADTEFVTAANVLGILASLDTEPIYRGSPHPVYPAALCDSIDAVQNPDDPRLWTITVVYLEPKPVYAVGAGVVPGGGPGGSAGGDPQTSSPEPEDRPPTLKVTYRRVDTYPDRDLDGVKFETRAGDRFDNPPPVPRSALVAEFTTHKAAGDWTAAAGRAYFNKVNSDAWQGFAARTCAVIGLTAEWVTEHGRSFWRLNWQIEVGEQDCQDADTAGPTAGEVVGGVLPAFADRTRVPHYGYMAYKTADTPASKEEIALNGKPLASPAKLNWNGTLRDADKMPLVTDFRVRGQISFAGL